MIAAPTLMPFRPLGANDGDVHCSGWICTNPTTRNNPITPSFSATINAFTQADSLVPITSSHVMTPTMAKAGKLKTMGMGPRCGAAARRAGSCKAARRSVTSQRGMVMPKPRSSESK